MSICEEKAEKSSSNTPETIRLKSIELGISIVIIIVNAVEITLLKRQRKKTRFELVLMSLSVADLLYGILNSSFQLIRIFEWLSADFFLIFNVRLFFMLASIFHLLLIGTDRLFAVAKPLQSKTIISKKKIYWAIFVIWLMSFGGLGVFKIYDNFDDTTNIETVMPPGKRPKPPPRIKNHDQDSSTTQVKTPHFNTFNKTWQRIDPTNKTDPTMVEDRNSSMTQNFRNETQKNEQPLNTTDQQRNSSFTTFNKTQRNDPTNKTDLEYPTMFVERNSSITQKPRNKTKNEHPLNTTPHTRNMCGSKSHKPPKGHPPPNGHPPRPGNHPPPPPPHILNAINKKENILAYCIITAAGCLIILYSVIIYFVQRAQQQIIRRRVSALSILIPVCFIAFTLPYAVLSLSSKHKTFFLPNVLLLSNSAVNSVLYFFKDIGNRNQQKRKSTLARSATSNTTVRSRSRTISSQTSY